MPRIKYTKIGNTGSCTLLCPHNLYSGCFPIYVGSGACEECEYCVEILKAKKIIVCKYKLSNEERVERRKKELANV